MQKKRVKVNEINEKLAEKMKGQKTQNLKGTSNKQLKKTNKRGPGERASVLPPNKNAAKPSDEKDLRAWSP